MRTRGFTLIELMIVVAIIGIIASIVVPKFSSNDNPAPAGAVEVSTARLACQNGIVFTVRPDNTADVSSARPATDEEAKRMKC